MLQRAVSRTRVNHLPHGYEIKATSLPNPLCDLIGLGGKIRFFKISKRTMVCLIKCADGWEATGISSTDGAFFESAMKARSLKIAVKILRQLTEAEAVIYEAEIREAQKAEDGLSEPHQCMYLTHHCDSLGTPMCDHDSDPRCPDYDVAYGSVQTKAVA